MKVYIEEKENMLVVVRLGDMFVDTDHSGLYLAAKVGSKFALVGIEGDYWGTWKSIEEFKSEVGKHVKEGRFIQYSQNEYVLELKKQVSE